jgi:mono/diheme cytochrome c family protein
LAQELQTFLPHSQPPSTKQSQPHHSMKFINTLSSRRILSVIATAAAIGGCRPTESPRFTPGPAVLALDDEAADDEVRQLWHDLQQQIDAELLNRCGTPLAPIVFGDPAADRARLKLGAAVYAARCQQCHGVNGDGTGAAAEYLSPKPRDYTQGIFKFTSTPYGAKPRRSDLLQTLRRGVTGTSMPSFDDLSPEDLEAVVDYVIFLSQRGELQNELVMMAQDEEELDPAYIDETVAGIVERWHEAQSKLVMPLTPMPAFTEETIAKGHELFLKQACNKCHGVNGRGGSMGNVEIGKDSWGNSAAAADLTSGMFRGGGRPIDIYRRIHSGINGTPMPAFSEVFAKEPDNVWYLVHFIRDTGERRRRNLPPLDDSTATPTPTMPPAPADAPTGAPAAKPAEEPAESSAQTTFLPLPSHPGS